MISHIVLGGGMAVVILISPFNSSHGQPPGGASPVSVGGPDENSVFIPAGAFLMGTHEVEVEKHIAKCKLERKRSPYRCEEVFDAETPAHRISIEAFYLDRTEVTNAEFERFVRATDYRTLAEREGRGRLCSYDKGVESYRWQDGAYWRAPEGPGSESVSDRPAVQVSWNDAAAYCQWAGKRLPTEAEWEYAARGPDGLPYPWGDRWSGDHARHLGNRAGATFAAVGSYPSGASRFGVLDLAGNVWEWTSSLFRPYPYDGKDGREGASATGIRVFRGGGWESDDEVSLRTAFRTAQKPTYRANFLGFRCARTAPRQDTEHTKSQ
jgi:formylglycine-generating enzyme required for sulfatase activity